MVRALRSVVSGSPSSPARHGAPRLALVLALAALTGIACGDESLSPAPTPDGGDPDAAADDTGDAQDEDDDSGSDAADGAADLADDPAVDADVADVEPRSPAVDPPGIFGAAGGCFALEGHVAGRTAFLRADTDRYAFDAVTEADATPMHLRAADLGTYLLFDVDGRFLATPWETEVVDAGEGEGDDRNAALLARVERLDAPERRGRDGERSSGEWDLEQAPDDPTRYRLRNGRTGAWLGIDGTVPDAADAAVISLVRTTGCAVFPELSLDAEGEVAVRTWEDGSVFGIVDAHSHILTNKGFGGGGMFHGAPFHRLGVEHALHDCSTSHGEEGRRDIIGYFYDGNVEFDVDVLLPILASARTPDANHATDGFPTFSDWPNAWRSSTHQVQYYRWLERAWRSGLRLVVDLATGNSVLCDFLTGIGAQETLYDCNDMVGVDRALDDARALERYIDAQFGGAGQGWFRIVESPAEARAVIAQGKLAVVLGIETSNLFDCFLSPPPGVAPCTPELVSERLADYHARGVRVIFPVHKYDNAFAPGDGAKGIIELGNMINSGHYSNFVEDCPFDRHNFDDGSVVFGGLNRPRTAYGLAPVLSMFGFASNPIRTLLPLLNVLQEPALDGSFCQNAGLTPLGAHLIEEIMGLGMIIDVAHLPQRAVVDALDLLEAAGYPASSTHGDTFDGRLFDIQGIGSIDIGRCANPNQPGTLGSGLRNRVRLLEERGLYPAAGFAFDFNGFAGSRRPRFGPDSPCPQPQPNPITYPFVSYDGAVEFTQPFLGDRAVDFNTEGMIHVGLLPELIEEARRDGVSDEELEPLFRSAEAYLRMWELAESRGEALRATR